MDTVTLDGKVYVKATKAATLAGYTSDYVGQLCRKGTLEGIVLGKTWYVQEESLLAHKQSQPRVNIAATRRDIQKQKETLHTSPIAESHVATPLRTEYRRGLTESTIRYSSDTHDLLPSIARETVFYPESTLLADSEPLEDIEPQVTPESSVEDAEQVIVMYREETANDHAESIDEAEDSEADYNTAGVDEERPVPVRKIAHVPKAEVSLAREARQMKDIRAQRPEKDTYFAQTDEVREEKTTSVSPSRVIVPYRSLLPMVCLLFLLFVLANLALESTWSYTSSDSKEAQLETTYNFASTGSILEMLKGINF